MIHLYCGDGKGKTTAAAGLALRAAGAGKRVLFAQFFKDGSSSEISMLRKIDSVRLFHAQTVRGFWFQLNDTQKARAAEDYTRLLREALAAAQPGDLLVLDEVISACNLGALPEEELLRFLDGCQPGPEVVLTGREPSPALLARADYITEMRKLRHPYDTGTPARKGIEY